MDISFEELYELVKDEISEDELRLLATTISSECGDLLDLEASAFMVVDEMGKNKFSMARISDLAPGQECTLYAKAARVYDPREFKTKDGRRSQVANIEITDDTGKCMLVLWGGDVELVKDTTIHDGTTLKIVNGYAKRGFYGIEINVGKWSLLEIEPEGAPPIRYDPKIEFTPLEKITDEGFSINVKAHLVERTPTRTFMQKDGCIGFVCDLVLNDSTAIRKLTIWGEQVKAAQRFNVGDELILRNLYAKKWNGEVNLNAGAKSEITKPRQP